MLKKILLGLAAVILVFVGVVATRPANFSVSRTATLPGTPDIAFALVNDFHQWGQWSPWDKLDPNLKRTFSGAETGVGAAYAWTGNQQVGEGRMTIEESVADTSIRIKLEFLKPFVATNTSRFTFKPVPEGVSVTWSMEGENNFISKAFSLFFDMDKQIGGDFEKGLASLNTLAKAESLKRAEEKAAAEKAAAEKAAAAQAPATGTPAVAAPTP
ncbi:SRPBCC family protein [Myxococcaceae bacterium JPH2]|nr:SRPBCC family protein [Myxococcaceae bacterium JPH2]